MTSPIDMVISRSQKVLSGEVLPPRSAQFKAYAMSNFRGGIGKTTLSFNLAYEVSRVHQSLFLDTCSQKNFSQNLLGDQIYDFKKTINSALVGELTGSTSVAYDDLVVAVKPYCPSFIGGKPSYLIPGSTELFLFPSLLYSQLAQYNQISEGYFKTEASARALKAVSSVIEKASAIAKPEKIIIDTSPFFGGATHLSWVAADALIIPVRVDQNSIEALHLTLEMLHNKTLDYHKFNLQAGLNNCPKVHAIAMTHCGWNRQKANTPDSSTVFFVQKALELAEQYSHLFSEEDVTNCFYLLDDFHSSGRISGKQRIPLSQLHAGKKYIVDGQRLEVNPAVDRYKAEIRSLARAL